MTDPTDTTPSDAGARLQYPPPTLYSSTYVGNPNLTPVQELILTEMFHDLSETQGAHEIVTHTKHHYGSEPDVTDNHPWNDSMHSRFVSKIDEAGPRVAANLDNEWPPLKLSDQLAWDDKTRNQWIAYMHGMLTTFTEFMPHHDQWGLVWKTPLTPPKRRQAWEADKLEDWMAVAAPWVPLLNEFPLAGIALDTFTAGQDEADWVVPLIENVRELFPDKPIFCVVSPTIKIGGNAYPMDDEEAAKVIDLRFQTGADGIHLFPVARNSKRNGGDFMKVGDMAMMADSCRTMMAHALDLWVV